ncbi:MAG: hypothetical protein KDC88_04145 [Ignavibacteriae bacterium]|nr:hypothetical protein [Ignavibacteriota bacterium]MCB9208080.1 hypothetical protein [Ignavibacteriales bacterium]MCB9258846.1 hypothetical protein [Ignavibacteriales bacterium]
MKKLIILSLMFLFTFFIGCKEESGVTNPNGINSIGDGNSGSVTFQVSIQQDQQHGIYFHFKPSVDVKIAKIDGTINGQTSSIDGDINSVMTVAEGFSISVYNAEARDKWSFKIAGKIASNNNDFVASVDYTVPADFTGGTSNVTIEINSQPGNDGSVQFLFKPSVDIKITKVNVEMGGATDELTGDNTTVYNGNNWHVLAGYTGVESGQDWSFTFTGTIVSNNQSYSVTSKYKVP